MHMQKEDGGREPEAYTTISCNPVCAGLVIEGTLQWCTENIYCIISPIAF